jgi:hypothetical protein
MKLLNQIKIILLMLIFIIILLAALTMAALILYKKKRDVRLKKEVNYRHIIEVDSEEFVPIEDDGIKDQMIIEKGGKRFTAIIRCRGFDYYTSNVEEKIRTKNHYVSFMSSLTEPMTYRMYGEDINMENTMKMYQGAKENTEEMLYNLSESYKEAQADWEAVKGTGSVKEEELYKYLLDLQKKLISFDWRLFHIEDQINYISKVSGPAAGRQKLAQTYVISWKNPGGPLSNYLSDEELYKKAIVELNKSCRTKIRQLNDCGVSAYRCSNDELLDMCRKHYHPKSSNIYTIKDIQNSVYFDEIATTNSIDTMNYEFEDSLVEEIMLGGEINA